MPGLMRFDEGPASRSAYVIAFETPEQASNALLFPDYSDVSAKTCNVLSVLYGKRFDNHGFFESTGMFQIPSLDSAQKLCIPTLAVNSHLPRSNFPVPLNLSEASRIGNALSGSGVDISMLRAFHAAAKFYASSLRLIEFDPEVAYLHLITTLEIISNHCDYSQDQLLDADLRECLSKLDSVYNVPAPMISLLRGRNRSIKRRFVQCVLDLTPPNFFSAAESKVDYLSLKQANYEKAIASAYDLRSQYVHTGVGFGRWVFFGTAGPGQEVQGGIPQVPSKELQTALANAPTLVELERVARACLLSFARSHGFYSGDA